MKAALVLIFIAIVLCSCSGRPARTTDSGVPNVATDIREVTPAEAQDAVSKAYSQFVDVRTAEEYGQGHAARTINIPLETLSSHLDRLDKSEPIYVICQTGRRSLEAAQILKSAGFNNVVNVKGGTDAWTTEGLPIETKSPHSVPLNTNAAAK